MNIFYLTIFLITLFFSVLSTKFVKYLSLRFDITDKPNQPRKIHKGNIPLLGGLAIFIAFFVMLFFLREKLVAGNLAYHHWLGFFAGACFLMIGGFLDDKYNLKPKYQVVWPILATLSVIAGGIGIEKITNPFGGLLYLDALKIPVLEWGTGMHYFMIIADTFMVLWLLGMMYTTKLLDGLDGLVTGITAIGGLIIFLFTMTTKYYQPDIGLAALVLSAACLGFLFFNWHPAKIFLGEGGSLLLGYALGVLAVISGGKIAIALLILGIPILDVAWTIVRRLAQGHNPFKFSDDKHLHFRILNLGFGVRKTVLVFYAFSLIFGLSALFLQSMGKLLALIIIVLIMLAVIVGFGYLDKKSKII